MSALKTQILFLIFNRPEVTRQVFEVIRQVRPEKIFIAADGPRENEIGEYELCQQTRAIVTDNIDWPCDLHTLFRDDNAGCKVAVSSAINWFFEHVEGGIILEDDCLPHPDFFQFCSDMLEYYRDDKRIWQINGTCWHRKKLFKNYSFTSYPLIWGWATWKDRWAQYDYEMNHLDEYLGRSRLNEISRDSAVQTRFADIFKLCREGLLDTWDVQWCLSVFYNRGICICPDCNLVSNIGFGEDATHTKEVGNIAGNRRLEKNNIIKFVQEPKISKRTNCAIERELNYNNNKLPSLKRFYYYLKHMLKFVIINITGAIHFSRSHKSGSEAIEANVKAFKKLLKKLLPTDKKVKILDVGYATGEAVLALKELGYSDVHGIDIDQKLIQTATAINIFVEHVVETESYLNSLSNSYDVILLIDILEHVPVNKQISFLKSIFNSLKNNGKLITVVPNAYRPIASAMRYGDFTHVCSFSPNSISFVMKNAGFNKIQVSDMNPKKDIRISLRFWRKYARNHYWELIARQLWDTMFRIFLPHETRPVPMSVNILVEACKEDTGYDN